MDSTLCCPGCLGTNLTPLGRKSGYLLRGCARCGVLFTREQAESQAIHDLYDHYYDNARFVVPPVVLHSLHRVVGSLQKFRRTGRWLDIGYGEGGLLGVVAQQGWQCYGTEISPAALRHGEQRGWVVSSNAESDERFPEEGFDVVTMVELLEHVPDPTSLLRAAARWLRPGGVLYLTTPNAASLNRRMLGLDWSIVSPPEHLTLWTASGVRRVLAAAGFRVQEIRTEGLNPSELRARYWPRPSDAAPSSRNESGLALNQAFSTTPFRRALKVGINRFLTFLQLGDSLKVRACRSREV